MRRQIITFALCLFAPVTASGARDTNGPTGPIAWRQCLRQRAEFYAGDEAVRIADNVLLYQRDTGGWPKNIDMASVLSQRDKAKLRMAKNSKDSMLDNGATHTQMRYLARVYQATGLERFRDAFDKGLDYLLDAQYENGGWPQRYPDPAGYARHITFNDGAMIGAMRVLRDITDKRPPFVFVDERARQKAEAAVQKGIDCILKCQIVVAGSKTAWCAQHNEKTFAPSKARSYELPSISGAESVGIVRFLMSTERPSPRIVEAVQCAVVWFGEARLEGIRQVRRQDKSKPRGWDNVIVKDASAPAMWARFYDIGTNKPIFCSRDGIPKATLAEISYERRTGYSWLGYYAADLLAKDYPAWQKKWAPETNVLGD
ncbi:MAG: pectate lyase [Planctomycetota bacterium]|jgi:PelA/Pel-15E family pectate lyase